MSESKFSKNQLTRSLPTTSIIVVTTEISHTPKNCKFQAFADAFKAWEWMHSILRSISKSKKFQFFSMQNLLVLKIPPAANVLIPSYLLATQD